MSYKRKTHRGLSTENVTHLMNQAERARNLATRSGSSLVADLLEIHAQCCEENAAQKAKKVTSRAK